MRSARHELIRLCGRFGPNRPQPRIARLGSIHRCSGPGLNQSATVVGSARTDCIPGSPGPNQSANAVGSARTDRKSGSPDANRSADAVGPGRTALQMRPVRPEPTANPDCLTRSNARMQPARPEPINCGRSAGTDRNHGSHGLQQSANELVRPEPTATRIARPAPIHKCGRPGPD